MHKVRIKTLDLLYNITLELSTQLSQELCICFFPFHKVALEIKSPLTGLSQMTIALISCACASIRSKPDQNSNIQSFSPVTQLFYKLHSAFLLHN